MVEGKEVGEGASTKVVKEIEEWVERKEEVNLWGGGMYGSQRVSRERGLLG